MPKQTNFNVLPAGSDPVKGSLQNGKYSLTVTNVRENDELTLQYPDGWERAHQAKTVQELAPKITNNLRARFGMASVSILTTPAIEEGAIIEVEVNNG